MVVGSVSGTLLQDTHQPASLDAPHMLPSVSGSSVILGPVTHASIASTPAYVTTVDWLVTTFSVGNVSESTLHDADFSATHQGSATSERQFHVGDGLSNTPIMLDFSATGSAYDSHTSSSPMQGPIAPPQRAPADYKYFGSCDYVCQHCNARFWWEERRTGVPASAGPRHQRCCVGGRAYLRTHTTYPAYITDLLLDRHFMDNIRAYNQMFAMTSFGATIDNSINLGRGPYVFKVSGQIYHWIGGFSPANDDTPRFLQLYIYDTDHEVRNRLSHFHPNERHTLREDIVQGLINFLDENNALVHLFRTARENLREADIPNFNIRLFGVVGAAQYWGYCIRGWARDVNRLRGCYRASFKRARKREQAAPTIHGITISASFYLWRRRLSLKVSAAEL
ncbi:hypothetical protein CTI12_AA456170 [Artemisia annua]|uniref:Helitron helicase-like domain-containing protein n=1 Tax=Artemisia annua TaxID=35608 RepID=A0A2U1LTD0_ARTAN|nr:hypothetical protein CTI12_AA456170 [Artemisia annua]